MKKEKKQKTPPTISKKSVKPVPSASKSKDKTVINEVLSSDSFSTKKIKARRYKSTTLAPPKKQLVSRSLPNTRRKTTTSTKPPAKKSSAHIDPTPISPPSSQASSEDDPLVSQAHSFRYFSEKSPKDIEYLNARVFRAERKLNPAMFVKYGIDKVLKEKHLCNTLTQVFSYNENMIREFYANLSVS